MSLFSRRRQIELPPLPERRTTVGKNTITQQPFLGATVEAELFDAQVPGYDLVRTKLRPPFAELMIRRPGARKVDLTYPVLTLLNKDDYQTPTAKLELEWEALGPLGDWANTPGKVLENWRYQFRFTEEDLAAGAPGLRAPQIGALHAIAAHFAVGAEHEAATIVLPTGTGKTETMLAHLVYARQENLLVVVPSNILRKQIGDKFNTLGVLPAAKTVDWDIARPFVARIAAGIHTSSEAETLLAQANVIIATPDSIKASTPEARAVLLGKSKALFVDEAHHITAPTWRSVKDSFKGRKIVQFTATPFRRDEKKVDGKIIFNFKLGDAQEAGYYKPINLASVEEFGEQSIRDRVIANMAVSVLRRDRNENGLDHLLLARTRTKERAQEVWKLYSSLAPEMNPVLVYSGPGRTNANRDALQKLYDRSNNGSRIVVCVDMLGEGVDLPNLKIAALHDNHKSLAVTLQFIGRITRKGTDNTIGDATVVTNIADPEAEKKLGDLYAEGADWDKIIKRLSEQRIDEEIQLQNVVEGLKKRGSLHTQLSLWNLRPKFSTQIFQTKCAVWTPTDYVKALRNSDDSWFALDEENNLLVAVIHRVESVDWGNYQTLEENSYILLLAWWDKEHNALFVYSNDYDAIRSVFLAKTITDNDTSLLNGDVIFKILDKVELPLAKSLGSSRVGAISFTSYFGPNVTEGLASIEKADSELNNIVCLGYEDGERVLWGGAKRKGKVWQQTGGSIAEWVHWCGRIWQKVTAPASGSPNITSDFLRPEKLNEPHPSVPVAVQWGEHAQSIVADQYAIFGDLEIPLFLVDLQISDVGTDDTPTIRISADLNGQVTSSEYRLSISKDLPGGYKYERISGAVLSFKRRSGDVMSIEEHLVSDPFIIRYADGTQSYNCYHIPADLNAGNYSASRLEPWSWTGIPLNRESMGKERSQDTIQFRTFENLEVEFDVVINDDGTGESGDLVGLKDMDESTIKLCLVHCKNAYGAKVSADIRNFYVLCGQAQKSVAIKHRGMGRLYHDIKRRHELWMSQSGDSRFLKGDIKKLAYFRDKARRSHMQFEVIIVQPGASAKTFNNDALKLLATTELYLKKTADAALRVITSE